MIKLIYCFPNGCIGFKNPNRVIIKKIWKFLIHDKATLILFHIWDIGFISRGADMLAHYHLAWAASFSLGLEAHSISSIPMWVFPVERDGLVFPSHFGFSAFIISFIQPNQ